MADLLNRHEAGTVSPIGYPDYASFSDVGEIDRFAQELGEAERSRAVKIAKGPVCVAGSSTSQRTGR